MEKQIASVDRPEKELGAPKESSRVIRPLSECGPQLPCGVNKGGSLNKDFECRPMKTADERVLAKLKKDGMNMGAYVSMIIGHQFTSFGGINLEKLKPAERTLQLGRCYMGDIFYAYVWLRRETMGDDLKMQVTCRCSKDPFEWVGQLGTVDVASVSNERDLEWYYELRTPIEVRRKTVSKLRLTQARWGTVANTSSGNAELARLNLIRGSVCGFNDDSEVIDFQDSEIDELSKKDLELLTEAFEPHWLGPQMQMEGQCPNCGRDFKSTISWEHGSFFGASSV